MPPSSRSPRPVGRASPGRASTIDNSSADAVARCCGADLRTDAPDRPRPAPAASGRCGRAPVPAWSPTRASGSPTRSGHGCRTRERIVEAFGELHRVGVESRQCPHRVARRRRIDVADAGDDRHDQIRPADRRRHAGDHADRHGGHVGGEQVVGEHLAVQRQHIAGTVPTAARPRASTGRGG